MPTIRDATPEDALAVAGVHVRSWQVAYRGLIDDELLDGLRPEDRAARYELGAERTGAPRTIVALEDQEIIGFATTGPCRDDDARDAAELFALYVDPPRWRDGVGRRLLAAATERMGGEGGAEAVLWVLRGNDPAERLYERAGWRRDGAERWEQPYGVVSRVFRMRRSLAPQEG